MKDLHLAFDRGVFTNLHRLVNCYSSLESIDPILKKNPYKITYEEYMCVQNRLRVFIGALNEQSEKEYRIYSRIELNAILWTK